MNPQTKSAAAKIQKNLAAKIHMHLCLLFAPFVSFVPFVESY
jgi:hypothetical protein